MLNNCLIISDGSKGMENQSIALAKILKLNFKILKIKPNLVLRIFPQLAHYFHFIFKKYISIFVKIDTNFVITTGKRMSGFSLLVKKIKRNKIINIHIQNPKINLNLFDIIVLPKHDKIKGNNVIYSAGSLSFFDTSDINQSFQYIKKKPFIFNKPTVFLLLGGKNKRYNANYSDYCRFLIKVKKSVEKISGNLIISTSRRTPEKISKIINILFKKFENDFCLINENKNHFYPGMLKKTDFAIVTSDSINMISEISTTNIPLFIGYLREEKGKIKTFLESFETNNYSKSFEGELYYYNKKRLKNNKSLKKNISNYIKNYLPK